MRPARSSPASWPTWWCLTATRSPARSPRSAAPACWPPTSRASRSSRRHPEARVQLTELGRGGPQVSRLGLGLMGMSGVYGPADEAESMATIRAALDAGITLLDTGDFYGMGHNELLLRDALRGADRSGVFIQVKFGGQRDPRGAFIGHDSQPGRGEELAGVHAHQARHGLRRPLSASPAGPPRSDRRHRRRDRRDDPGRVTSATWGCRRWARSTIRRARMRCTR